MFDLNNIETFPTVSIPPEPGTLPVEVTLIAQMGHGEGNQLYTTVTNRQQKHNAFIDEHNEPSAKIGGVNLPQGDATALYSFSVGPNGHPFHRHAGHRIFTAISGSGGAQLRFSSATDEQISADPNNFINSLRFINIPADCLFTVRFGGNTWHQFYPLSINSKHPVFFAISCHTNELGGALTAEQKDSIISGNANIPYLTELLPPSVLLLLNESNFDLTSIPTTTLALDAPAGTFHRIFCDAFRSTMGLIRGRLVRFRKVIGFKTYSSKFKNIKSFKIPLEGSLLLNQFSETGPHYDETIQINVPKNQINSTSASTILSSILDGFLHNQSSQVTNLMQFRNTLVRPFGLRISHLGCPVSSLLSTDKSNLYAQKFPVLEQSINNKDSRAQVLLGADDRHLKFRSCVGVEIINNNIQISLGTRVQCINIFGHFYMASINYIHNRYISPNMLRMAIEYSFGTKTQFISESDLIQNQAAPNLIS